MESVIPPAKRSKREKLESSVIPLESHIVQELVYSSEEEVEEEGEEDANKARGEEDSLHEDTTDTADDEDIDMAAHVNRFLAEVDVKEGKQRKRLLEEGVRAPKRKGVLPPHLHSVMGNANLRLARGDTAGAIELSMEVIRQGLVPRHSLPQFLECLVPHASEPYLTLATVYEDMGDTEKLLQILLIAAHLKRSDIDLWIKSGTLAVEQHNLNIAVQCFTKAIHLDPTNKTLYWRKASLLCEMKEHRKAIDTLEQLLTLLPPEAGQQYMEISKEIATLYNELKDTHKAIKVLGKAIVSQPMFVDEETINILAELCIICKAYQQVYEVIVNFYNMIPPSPEEEEEDGATPMQGAHVTSHDSVVVQLTLPLTEALRVSMAGEDLEEDKPQQPALEEQPRPSEPEELNLLIPDDMAVDLRVKLAVSMIHLGMIVPEDLLHPMFVNPEDYGDLFLDITDAYMENGAYSQALPLLSALVNTGKYSQAGVWLKYAECQHMLNDLEAAAMSYSKVISLAPHHTDTRLQLATLYVQLGLADDALSVLEAEPGAASQGETEEEDLNEPSSEMAPFEHRDQSDQDFRILLHKYNLLVSKGRLKEYVSAGCDLLAFLFRDVYNRPEIKVMIHLKSKKKKVFRSNPETSKAPLEVRREEKELESLLSPQEWLKVFIQTCTGLWQLGPSCYQRIIHLVYCAAIVNKFSERLEKAFVFYAASLTFILGDYGTTFMLLRELCFNEPGCKHLWNFMNTLPLDIRIQKFILRLCFKHSSNPYSLLVLSNYSHSNSHYKFALSQYELAYRETGGSDYLLCLCIAIVYINMASQIKHPPNKNAVVTQATGFLHKYIQLRGHCQESMYNLGRAFHQLGVVHTACQFYKRVLSLEPECPTPEWCRASDLRGEAAFNLSLIYRTSGNQTLALDILRKYCTI